MEQGLQLCAWHAAAILSAFRGKGKPGVSPAALLGKARQVSSVREIEREAQDRAYRLFAEGE